MIKPLPGYVLIEPIEDDTKEIGGVYLPDSVKDKPMKGKLISFGDITKDWGDQWHISSKIKIPGFEEGSTVFYKKWTNQEINHEGKIYLLVHFNELLAVLE